MRIKTTPGSDTRRCPACRRRTRHSVSAGPIEFDTQRPGDRRYAVQRVTYRCDACKREEHRVRLPSLLEDVFHT